MNHQTDFRALMNVELHKIATLIPQEAMRRLIRAWIHKTCAIFVDTNFRIHESVIMREAFIYHCLGPELFRRGLEQVRTIRQILTYWLTESAALSDAGQDVASQDVTMQEDHAAEHAAEERGHQFIYI